MDRYQILGWALIGLAGAVTLGWYVYRRAQCRMEMRELDNILPLVPVRRAPYDWERESREP